MESAARLVIRLGSQPEQEYPITQEITIAGREAINDLVVNDAEVSRRHCRIMLEADGYLIEDLGSTNGTFVNGQRVTAPMILYHGDTIELGKSAKLLFLGAAPRSSAVSSATAAPPPSQQPISPAYNEPPPPSSSSGYQQQPPAQSYQQQPPPQQPPTQHVNDDDYYMPPESEPLVVGADDEEDEPTGCQRYLVSCGCLVLLFLFLLGATLFILDQAAPDFLYCGPFRPIWETLLGPLLEAFDRPLACP